MKKKLLTIAIALLTLLSIGGGVFAEEGVVNSDQVSVTSDKNTNLVATVNFYEGKIISQENNIFKVHFRIGNRIGIQPNVKYGLNLIQADDNGNELVVDEKIYDETLVLGENSSISRDVVYVVPDFLSGNFILQLISYSKEGLPLAFYNLSDKGVDINSERNGVFIKGDSCLVKIDGMDDSKQLLQGIDIAEDEMVHVICDIDNTFSDTIQTTPKYVFFNRTVYSGEVVGEKQGQARGVVLKSGENQQVDFLIPIIRKPQAYDVKIFLTKNNKKISNDIIFHYVARGESATIHDIRLNKSSYDKGDVAKVSFFVSGSANNFAGARKSFEKKGVQGVLKISIKNNKGKLCADIKQLKVNNEAPDFPINVDLNISKNCQEPKIDIELNNNNGDILDNTSATIKLSQDGLEKNKSVSTKVVENKLGSNLLYVVITIILTLLLIAFTVWFIIRNRNNTINILILGIIFAGSLFGITSTKTVLADTYYSSNSHVITVVNWPGNNTYSCGDNIMVGGMISSVLSCGNAVFDKIDLDCGIDNAFSGLTGSVMLDTINCHVDNCDLDSHNLCKVCSHRVANNKNIPTPSSSGNYKVVCGLDMDYISSSGSHNANVTLFSTDYNNYTTDTPIEFPFSVTCPATCTGFLSPGATICSGTTIGLTADTPWHKVSDCTGASKCAYTKKAECGLANGGEYHSEADLKNTGLCQSGFTPSAFTEEPTEFSDTQGNFSGRWVWTCSKSGYDTSDTCSATKYGQCNDAPTTAPYTSLNGQNGACRFGHFNSVSVDNNGVFKWTCGTNSYTGVNTRHIGSFNSSDASTGSIVPADNYEPVTGGSNNCQCTAQYKYYCQSAGYNCTNKCGQNVEEIYQAYKEDKHCFPNENTRIMITQQEYNSQPISSHGANQPSTCTNKSVTCPPCGAGGGGSDTINETN